MLFNSWLFAGFMAVVLPLYFVLRHRSQNIMLLLASYVFYGAWDWKFLGLIALSTVIDYTLGLQMHGATDRKRKWCVAVSCASNLSILGFFKYFDFFSDSLAALMLSAGLEAEPWLLDIVLPVGISFYTFQTLSYTIDIYRREVDPVRNFFDFALFVSFFPQLVAGPIERAKSLLPQILAERTVTRDLIRTGAWLVLVGLFKKMVIADNLAPIVDLVYGAEPGEQTSAAIWLATYAFAVQIYCDFSGYTDIARGVANLLGFRLMRNFNLPYLANSPADFWHRWHISLSTWLRDYLYIPLGGNRKGPVKTYRNLMLTMVLGGLWHGAAWNFVIWGFYQGLLLCVHRLWVRRNRDPHNPTMQPTFAARVMTILFVFHLVCYGWLLFRARSLEQVYTLSIGLFNNWQINHQVLSVMLATVFYAGLLIALEAWTRSRDDPRGNFGWRVLVGPTAVALMLIALVQLTPTGGQQFIYFQF